MISIDAKFEMGQVVYNVTGVEISKVTIRGAFEEEIEGKKRVTFIIMAVGRPQLIAGKTTFATFEEARNHVEDQEIKHVKLAEERLDKIQNLEDNIKPTPEKVDPKPAQKATPKK